MSICNQKLRDEEQASQIRKELEEQRIKYEVIQQEEEKRACEITNIEFNMIEVSYQASRDPEKAKELQGELEEQQKIQEQNKEQIEKEADEDQKGT